MAHAVSHTAFANRPAACTTGAVASVARRAFVAAVCALAAVLFALCCVRPAAATEPAGYLTVAGVAGVDESVAYPTFSSAVAAVASCDPVAQFGAPSGVAIVVHGTVYLDVSGLVDLCYPVEGAACALVGADASSRVVLAAGPVTVSNAAGSLLVHGLAVEGDLSLSARDNVAVDVNVFYGQLLCEAGGSIDVAGNVFDATLRGGHTAVTAHLLGTEGRLGITGNTVTGYPRAAAVACFALDNAVSVHVSSNLFDFSLVDPALGETPTLMCLMGGPWSAASVVRDGNTVVDAEVLLWLDDSFVAEVQGTDPVVYEGVIEGNLTAQTVVSLFELLGPGTSDLPQAITAVAVNPAFEGLPVFYEVALASQTVLPAESLAAAGAGMCTVSYDGNGATAGMAPEPVTVECGATVSVSHMGSLVNPNCIFEGWNTAPDGSGTFYAVGQIFSVQGNLVLYAQWASTGTVATMDVLAAGEASL